MDDAEDTRGNHVWKINRLRGTPRRMKASGNWWNTLLTQFLIERSAQQQIYTQEMLEIDEIQNQMVQFLPDDLLFKIFILLPTESLSTVQYVCKNWFSLINSSVFIRFHAEQAETVLICKKLALSPELFDGKPKRYFHFLDFDHGRDNFVLSSVVNMVDILASCNGLVLAKWDKNKSLVIANPITRKYAELPLHTSTGFLNESYNLLFCNEAKTYKVIHLFFSNDSRIDCEILSVNVNTRTWKRIEGFSSELFLGVWRTISVGGSLYWKNPRENGRSCFVALNVNDEKFDTLNLPTSYGVNDRLIEFGGDLGLVTHATHNLMQVWIFDQSNGNWTRRYDIDLDFGFGYSAVPICSTRNGKEVVFAYPGGHHLYAYNLDKRKLKLVYSLYDVETLHRSVERFYIPHRSTLASW